MVAKTHLEAARYGCKILHGPNVWNFDEIYIAFKKITKFQIKFIILNQLAFKSYTKCFNEK